MDNITLLILLATSVTGFVEVLKRFIDYTELFRTSPPMRKIFLFSVAIVAGEIVAFTTIDSSAFLRQTFLSGLDPTLLQLITGLIIGYGSIYPYRLQQLLSAWVKTSAPVVESDGNG